jgi:hypothetical protein
MLSISLLHFRNDRAGSYRQAMRIEISFAQEKETVVVKDIHLRYGHYILLNTYMDESRIG